MYVSADCILAIAAEHSSTYTSVAIAELNTAHRHRAIALEPNAEAESKKMLQGQHRAN